VATVPATESMNSPVTVLVIMGAAVWADGQPSNAMRRRVKGALTSARHYPNTRFLVSGGVGVHPPSEAEVMARLLRESGVPEPNILREDQSTDTMESVRRCVDIVSGFPDLGNVVICSDVYHIPRCRWLFRLLGIRTLAGEVQSGRCENSWSRWMYYLLREVAALPWDTLVVLPAILRARL
jgi:vancomycin permeability regulator SanA